MALSVAIRVDATSQTGTGHFMRCLALADALAARGGAVRFVSRALPASLEALAREKGHALVQLRAGTTAANEDLAHSRWLEAGRDEDAEATREALEGVEWDWLVVDHYGIDASWEKQLRQKANKVLVIDDIADREHDCDVLVDQNVHPEPGRRYSHLVPAHAERLVGPRYALLRPEFSRAREVVEPRSGRVKRILVFFGGMDVADWTSAGLDAVTKVARPGTQVDVVIGAQHPRRAAIEQRCREMQYGCHVQTSQMATLMAAADLGLGAGGSATWERACLGLPTLAISVAQNQHELLANAARAGLVYVPDPLSTSSASMTAHLEALLTNSALRESLSAAGMELVDGRGAQRVTSAMWGAQVTARLAQAQDCDHIHKWRNAPAVRSVSRKTEPISLEDHRRWFEHTLRSPDCAMLVGEDPEGPVGVVRFDIRGNEAEVSIYLAEPRLGQGLGPSLLRTAEAWLAAHQPQVDVLRAETLTGNGASRRLFEQNGYLADSQRFVKRTKA